VALDQLEKISLSVLWCLFLLNIVLVTLCCSYLSSNKEIVLFYS
jgi:hypothetical protein